jgi:hypothetical protein
MGLPRTFQVLAMTKTEGLAMTNGLPQTVLDLEFRNWNLFGIWIL